MNLRLVVLLLLSANIAFYAWTQGWLDNLIGVRAGGDREPERLARQVRPETVRVLSPRAASAAMATASAATPTPAGAGLVATCLEAGPYSLAEVNAVEGLVKAVLPAGSWARRSTERPASWIVYMGKYASRDTLEKKEDELRRIKLPFEEVDSPPDLAFGLALGRYNNRVAADAALAQLALRGLRTARVVGLAAATVYALRIERADSVLAAMIAGLQGDVRGEPLGKAFAGCASAGEGR